MNKDEFYMKLALEEAKIAYDIGEVPVGAVVIFDDKIISKGHNLRETSHDITKHAEINVIKEASKQIKDWRLDNMIMYVTLFPCPMCASAIVSSRIKKLIIGAPTKDDKIKELGLKILSGNNTSPKVEIVENILSNQCQEILSKFFQNQRENK